MTIRSDNTFIRPKWGIYRSLNNQADLRDEAVRFAGFSVAEETVTAINDYRYLDLNRLKVYPNPANKSTIIKYTLPENGYISLSVYSLSGIRIRTLLNNEYRFAGEYTSEIDLAGLGKGCYVVHLLAGNRLSTVKLNVL